MKPLSEKTYVDQALKNGKGVTWLDDCRIGTEGARFNGRNVDSDIYGKYGTAKPPEIYNKGRFPANLLVSDDVLNDGRITKSSPRPNSDGKIYKTGTYGNGRCNMGSAPTDSGSYSRFFSLDAWAKTLPFLIVPKAAKKEKDRGLDAFPIKRPDTRSSVGMGSFEEKGVLPGRNSHATVKPITLMSYLITLGSRPGDTVLDPFVGSGTTVCAAKMLGRKGVGIEREEEYVRIAQARLDATKSP